MQEIKGLLATSSTTLHYVREVTEDANHASGVLTLLLQKQPLSSAAPSA